MTPETRRTTDATPLARPAWRWAPALLLAAAATLAACGGSSSTPADTTPPTVAVTDDTAAAVATGDVTFRFTFSEDVGTSFAATDVAVTGGTAGAFTKVNATFYTLVVSPTADALGTATVTVAAGAFSDLAGNASTAAATGSQDYDTRVAAQTQMTLPVSFDSATVAYGLLGFGGAEDSTIVADPTNAANKVAQVVKSATAELWAGTTLTDDGTRGFAAAIPFDASNTRMTVKVWSPDAGIPVRLKVEDAADGTHSCETEATTTVANAWETLTFDFASPAAGTAALNFAFTYDKASIFFNFGTTGATAGAKTYYFDDVTFIGGGGTGGGGGGAFATVTFDDPTVTYSLVDFGGDVSSFVADPADAANTVAQVVKVATAELWAGTTVVTGANDSVGTMPFDAANTRMTVKVWSPDAGIPVRLKVEDAADPTRSCETEATTTVANAWETLTFDFASQAAGTAPLNFGFTYDKISIFFNFGTTGAQVGADKTYLFDDVTFIGGTSGGGGGAFATVTFDDPTVTYVFTGFGGAEDASLQPDPAGAANTVARVVKSATAETWAGTTFSTGALDTVGKIPFDAANTRMTVRVWSPDAGIQVRLKVEDHTNGGISVETEATTTVANAWETLTFDFANPAAGTAALNVANTYDRASIFFNFGVGGVTAGAKTYYFDDVTFLGGTGGGGGTGATREVFADDYAAGVTFVDFGGATNSISIDAAEAHSGTSSLRVLVPASNYTGGAMVAATPQDLSAYNAVSFWLKASKVATLNVTGFGDAAALGPSYKVESLQIPVDGTWTRHVIPIPVAARLTGSQGLFHFAEGPEDGAYTLWIDDVVYLDLPAAEVGTPTAANVGWGAVNVAVGATFGMSSAANAITWGPPVVTNGGNLTNVGFRYFTLTSSNPAVATVDADGVVTGHSGGTAQISATLGSLVVPGVANVTVTAPLAEPTTIAAAPTAPAADVISMFSSAYTNVGVDTWSTGWSACCNTLTDPFDIAGHAVKRYELRHFAGIEFLGANVIDASAMNFLHLDVWTPNGTEFQVRLVNAVGAGQTEATVIFNAASTPAVTTGAWISLDIPLSAFTGLAGRTALGQMLLLVPTGTSSVFYVDNVYFHK